MSDLVNFAKRIETRLSDALREPHWAVDEAAACMAAIAGRRARFEPLAARLGTEVIRPRLIAMANHFANAQLSEGDPAGHCTCWLGFCERFPASVKVSFSVEHDLRLENVIVHYDASMLPQFVRFHGSDDGIWPLDDVTDDAVAAWVEARLLDFLDVYLQIDRGLDDFADEPVTDPVCGMRIGRSSVAASHDYRGHAYYFCSRDCRDKFADNPTAYVHMRMV